MNPWIGKVVFLLGLVVFVAIRVPHDKRSKEAKISESRKGILETALLVLIGFGCFLIPLLFITTGVLSFADYCFGPLSMVSGSACLTFGLWLFYRSHADLSTNWSATLELREDHRLVTAGIYESVRHPMYTSFFVYGVAQVLLLPNWIAGPAFLVAFAFMFAFRVGREERMMLEKFGQSYEGYMLRTRRLIPGLW